MKFGLSIRWVLALALVMICAPRIGTGSAPEEVLALHWHPATAMHARQRTLAAAAWLDRSETAGDNWRQELDAIVLELERSRERIPWQWAPLGDGLFAWLVGLREKNLEGTAAAFPQPGLNEIDDLLRQTGGGGQIARLAFPAALDSPRVWERLATRLAAIGTEQADNQDVQAEGLLAHWSPLIERVEASSSDWPDRWMDHARGQAQRVVRLRQMTAPDERARVIDEILRAEVDLLWHEGEQLSALWLLLESLARLTRSEQPEALAEYWVEWLDNLVPDEVRGLRRIDSDLPVFVALVRDAAGYLADADSAVQPAIGELSDAYARLALFAPDMAFYLDQPVRRDIRRTVAACNPDPLLAGPLPRELFERCAQDLIDLLVNEVDSEELVGGAQGPFAPEFLRRELGLVSWQRAAYLDGHLNWMLEAPCETPHRVNVLEWSLLVERLARWVRQRPVFFDASRWQNALVSLERQAQNRLQFRTDWLDCLTGQGSERRDPVVRLLALQQRALGELSLLLGEARSSFYNSVLRPGADIDLDGPANQTTSYRPEGLTVGPCPEANTCGAQVELPVSRALLGLFPNAYLLADQMMLGQVGICYEQVRWVDRRASPARENDREVANYHGRLSFDLVGDFSRAGRHDTVFRYRFGDRDERHYLFAAYRPDILDLECPRELIGASVASQLPEGHAGLVPNRLTYFVSAPTTPEALLVGNWDRGAEWRDWFITGNRAEQIERVDGEAIEVAVQAQLAALSARRERQLAAPVTNPVRAEEDDPLALAMATVADTSALLRRVLEIHYPRVIRHHAPVRRLLAGEDGLLTRDRVRSLRDRGVPVSRIPLTGQERLEQMRTAWLELPMVLREQGQPPPEVDYGRERLTELMRLSRGGANESEASEGR